MTNGTAAAPFTVKAKTAADHETNSPKPGDNSHVALLVVLLFVGGGLLTITVIKGVDTELKRRKRHE